MAADRKTAETPAEEPGKKRAPWKKTAQITTEEMIQKYLEVYKRCMTDDPKSFDAKGALGALDQIVKVLGLEAPVKLAGADGARLRITLENGADERGG